VDPERLVMSTSRRDIIAGARADAGVFAGLVMGERSPLFEESIRQAHRLETERARVLAVARAHGMEAPEALAMLDRCRQPYVSPVETAHRITDAMAGGRPPVETEILERLERFAGPSRMWTPGVRREVEHTMRDVLRAHGLDDRFEPDIPDYPEGGRLNVGIRPRSQPAAHAFDRIDAVEVDYDANGIPSLDFGPELDRASFLAACDRLDAACGMPAGSTRRAVDEAEADPFT
jgi:hypothetical protein